MAAAGIHLVIAALFSTHVRVESFIPWVIEHPLQLYGGYSGAATRFNFFAPSVPTQPRVLFTLRGRDASTRTVELLTASNEANQRIATMFSLYELVSLRPLVLRSWAVYVLTRYPDAESVEVRVEIFDIPTMAEARAGRKGGWVESERLVLRRDEIS
jgi:hypothetical protein